MAERQRNMIEQERITAKQIKERNMAEQIKDFLDKGIPKADIAKATKFSLEYIDSLLEKYSPNAPEKDQDSDIQSQLNQDSDIQSQLNFFKQQVQILQKKLDNKEFENVQLKQQLNTIQAKGANMPENNEPIQTQQAVQQWEYMSTRLMGGLEQLNKLGEQGWEVVDGIKFDAGRELCLKRPKQKKKEPDYGYGR